MNCNDYAEKPPNDVYLCDDSQSASRPNLDDAGTPLVDHTSKTIKSTTTATNKTPLPT